MTDWHKQLMTFEVTEDVNVLTLCESIYVHVTYYVE